MGLLDVIVIGFVGLVLVTSIERLTKTFDAIPPQEVTSPRRPELGGLRSTNKVGLDFETAIANFRDNITFGGTFFQG